MLQYFELAKKGEWEPIFDAKLALEMRKEKEKETDKSLVDYAMEKMLVLVEEEKWDKIYLFFRHHYVDFVRIQAEPVLYYMAKAYYSAKMFDFVSSSNWKEFQYFHDRKMINPLFKQKINNRWRTLRSHITQTALTLLKNNQHEQVIKFYELGYLDFNEQFGRGARTLTFRTIFHVWVKEAAKMQRWSEILLFLQAGMILTTFTIQEGDKNYSLLDIALEQVPNKQSSDKFMFSTLVLLRWNYGIVSLQEEAGVVDPEPTEAARPAKRIKRC